MPLPPNIIEHPSKHWSDRGGQPIRAIVAHGTVGTDSLGYLTENPRKVSIPYLIARDGTIYHMVTDERAANHAGAPTSALTVAGVTYRGGEVNQVTTGFELESEQKNTSDDYTGPQLLSMGWLINDIRRHHGPLPLFRHAQLDPTRRSDPVGLSVATMEEWARRAAGTHTRVIGVAPSISLLQLQTWLTKYHAPLSPVDAEHVYRFAAFLDIDPAFIAAIWQHETSANGAIGASDLYRKSNNAGAIRAYGRWPSVEYNGASWNAYESPQLGLMALIFHIKQIYGAAGFYEVETIIPQYAPAGDGNAPQAYIDAVRAAMQEMRNT